MTRSADRGFQQQLERVEDLVATLEGCPDPAARELVRTLLDFHGAGLSKMLDLTREAGDPGRALIDGFAGNTIVSSLLLLHGLHPTPIETRVAQAIECVRPRLRARGGDAELLENHEESVRIRLRGDASAAAELRSIIEKALIEAAPDVGSVDFEEVWDHPPSGRLSLPLIGTGA